MKKTLFLLSAVSFVATVATAQISINTGDVAAPSTVLYQATDTLPAISVGTANASTQNWNMAALAINYVDTLHFLPYSSAPNPLFSTSNLVVKQGWQNNFAYALNTGASLTILGNHASLNIMGSPTVINQRFTPAEKIADFPFGYNSNITNNYRTMAKFYYGQVINTLQVDSIRNHSSIHKTIVVDAWGTLTTPLGVYNVIRSKETKITRDSTDAYVVLFPPFGSWQNAVQTSADSTTSYTWWANGLGFSLVTATMDSVGNVKNAQWLMQPPSTVGIDESFVMANENVFPNPAQNEINFMTDAAGEKSIQVFDITGRLVDSYAVAENMTTINTVAYANGLYTYSITGVNNTVVNRGKFTIAK